MTKLGIAINLERCVGCNTCANACKMQNNIPMNMLYIRVETDGVDAADGAQGTYPDLTPHLHPRGVPALREPRLPEGVPRRAPRTKTTWAAWKSTTTSASAAASAWPLAPTTPACSTGASPSAIPTANYGDKDVPVRPKGVAEKCTLCKERTDRGESPMCVRVLPGPQPACSAIWTIPKSEISKVVRENACLSCCWRSRAPARKLRYFNE